VAGQNQAEQTPGREVEAGPPVKIVARIPHKSERHRHSSHGKSGIQSLNSSSKRTIILGSSAPSLIEPQNKC
jgi:hypothetical protein